MEISLIYYSSVGTIAYGTDKILPSSTVPPTLYICIFRPYNKLRINPRNKGGESFCLASLGSFHTV